MPSNSVSNSIINSSTKTKVVCFAMLMLRAFLAPALCTQRTYTATSAHFASYLSLYNYRSRCTISCSTRQCVALFGDVSLFPTVVTMRVVQRAFVASQAFPVVEEPADKGEAIRGALLGILERVALEPLAYWLLQFRGCFQATLRAPCLQGFPPRLRHGGVACPTQHFWLVA